MNAPKTNPWALLFRGVSLGAFQPCDWGLGNSKAKGWEWRTTSPPTNLAALGGNHACFFVKDLHKGLQSFFCMPYVVLIVVRPSPNPRQNSRLMLRAILPLQHERPLGNLGPTTMKDHNNFLAYGVSQQNFFFGHLWCPHVPGLPTSIPSRRFKRLPWVKKASRPRRRVAKRTGRPKPKKHLEKSIATTTTHRAHPGEVAFILFVWNLAASPCHQGEEEKARLFSGAFAHGL